MRCILNMCVDMCVLLLRSLGAHDSFGRRVLAELDPNSVFAYHFGKRVRVNLCNKLFAFRIASGQCLRLRAYYLLCSFGYLCVMAEHVAERLCDWQFLDSVYYVNRIRYS
jgi:hypothetical protein